MDKLRLVVFLAFWLLTVGCSTQYESQSVEKPIQSGAKWTPVERPAKVQATEVHGATIERLERIEQMLLEDRRDRQSRASEMERYQKCNDSCSNIAPERDAKGEPFDYSRRDQCYKQCQGLRPAGYIDPEC